MQNDAQLLIRLPADLKGAFDGLCKARGVGVSDEIRRLMSDEVQKSLKGLTTRDRTPVTKTTPPTHKKAPMPLLSVERCHDTIEMFEAPKTPPMSDLVARAINASNKRKKKR